MNIPGLLQQVSDIEVALRAVARGLDPDEIPAVQAPRVFDGLERIVRIASGARTLMARRVDDSLRWRKLGYASAAEMLAARSGTSLGAAKAEMDTSKSLQQLPETAARLLDGTLSPSQGSVIAGAAKANPEAERGLIDSAAHSNLKELRDQAQRAKAAADPDPAATHARIHRERRCSRFGDAEGARLLHLRGPADLASVIEAELDRLGDQIFRDKARVGSREPREAYAYDAMVEMARRSRRADEGPDEGSRGQGRPEHLALLRLDVAALWRGHVEGDELCEIAGLGPIPVAVARRLLGDAVLKLIITKGIDVANVTSLTRGPTQAMRYALLWDSPTCVVSGCTRTIVEHDHAWGAEFKDTRHSRYDELKRVCHHHHDLHTLEGWALVGDGDNQLMVAPEDPRHPGHVAATSGPDPPVGA